MFLGGSIMAKEVITEEQEKPHPEVTVSEMRDEVQSDIDGLQDQLDKKFEARRDSLLVVKQTKDYFIVKNKFWDMWFQKIFSQLISVKIWIITLITILLVVGLITDIQFASILGIIMGLKGAFSVADVWKRNGTRDTIIDRV